MGPHQGRAEGEENLPRPAAHTPPHATYTTTTRTTTTTCTTTRRATTTRARLSGRVRGVSAPGSPGLPGRCERCCTCRFPRRRRGSQEAGGRLGLERWLPVLRRGRPGAGLLRLAEPKNAPSPSQDAGVEAGCRIKNSLPRAHGGHGGVQKRGCTQASQSLSLRYFTALIFYLFIFF